MKLYTIGHGKKSAKAFFTLLMDIGIQQLIDVRLKNTSQLAGFAKKDDLAYFLSEISDISYIHEPLFTPTEDMLNNYKKKKSDWNEYESAFSTLIKERKIEKYIDVNLFKKPTALLCSCPSHEECHRKVVAEYLQQKWKNIEIQHI